MSVIFIPPSSAASIADATETSAGKIRIATSAEATAGTNDVTAMTPAKVKAVVDAAVAGGVTYKGTFDAGSPADLSNALKGDLYIISGAGTYAGRSWAVGDHLLVNADMGGTLDSSKLDKIDSTDSVTSVAGRTGAVVLSAGDVSGLATVATSGSYNDLSNKPTLGTAAALDVGTSALNIVQLDASAKLPAIDGSQLTNLPSGASTLGDLTDVTITSVADRQVLTYDSASSDWINSAVAYADVSGTPTLGTAAALDVGTSALNVVQLDASSKLPAVDGSQLTNLPSGASTLGALSDVTLTSVTNGQVLTYDSASGDWVNASNTATFASVSSYSASATLSPSSNRLIRASNTITLTLPAASASTVGSFLHIKNVGVNVITVAAAGADTIDGGASVTIDIPKNSISVYCISASAWEIF